MQAKKITIEFTGIGGVGKSTILEQVCKLLDESKVPYDNSTTLKEKKITLKNIPPVIKAILLTMRVKPRTLKGFITILKGLTKYQMIYQQIDDTKSIRLFDEGIIHKARAARRNSRISSMLDILRVFSTYNEIPDVLVIVEADPSKILQRRINRNRKIEVLDIQSIIDETNDSDFKKTIECLKKGKFHLGKRVKVIYLKNIYKSDVLKNAKKIVSFIQKENEKLKLS